MLKPIDRHQAKKRAKKWDKLGFYYKSVNQLTKKHSLKCGCSMCRWMTYEKHLRNKQDRIKIKKNLKNYINEEIN